MEKSATSVQIGKNSAEDANQALRKKIATGFKRLRDAFRHYDTDKDGSISLQELRIAAAHAGIQLNKQEAQRLMSMIDSDENGNISNTEFMQYFSHLNVDGQATKPQASLITGDNKPLLTKRQANQV